MGNIKGIEIIEKVYAAKQARTRSTSDQITSQGFPLQRESSKEREHHEWKSVILFFSLHNSDISFIKQTGLLPLFQEGTKDV